MAYIKTYLGKVESIEHKVEFNIGMSALDIKDIIAHVPNAAVLSEMDDDGLVFLEQRKEHKDGE